MFPIRCVISSKVGKNQTLPLDLRFKLTDELDPAVVSERVLDRRGLLDIRNPGPRSISSPFIAPVDGPPSVRAWPFEAGFNSACRCRLRYLRSE